MSKKTFTKNILLIGGIISVISLFMLSCADPGNENKGNGGHATPTVINKTKPVVKVYIENSGSMDGYINTDFRRRLGVYLTRIGSVSEITDSLSLNFINRKIIKFESSQVTDFIDKLNPHAFRILGGSRESSDISEMLDTICPCSENEVVLFVSDCIFSPGKGKNAEDYLSHQQMGIMGTMKSMKKKMPSAPAVVIYRVLGEFDGRYFDKNNMFDSYRGIRPYYIWLIGSKENLMDFVNQVPFENPDRVCMISSLDRSIDYAVVPGGGNYSVSKNSPHAIDRAKVDSKSGRMVVKVKVNFSNILQPNEYLEDISNYVLSDRQFSIDKIEKCGLKNFTHIITLSSKNVKRGKFKIQLKNYLPSWIEEYNDDMGYSLAEYNDNLEKTYGLKYMVDGVYDVFTYENKNLAEIEISIN